MVLQIYINKNNSRYFPLIFEKYFSYFCKGTKINLCFSHIVFFHVLRSVLINILLCIHHTFIHKNADIAQQFSFFTNNF